jgi:hypothetical protein
MWRERGARRGEVVVLTGVNLATLIDYLHNRDKYTCSSWPSACSEGQESIRSSAARPTRELAAPRRRPPDHGQVSWPGASACIRAHLGGGRRGRAAPGSAICSPRPPGIEVRCGRRHGPLPVRRRAERGAPALRSCWCATSPPRWRWSRPAPPALNLGGLHYAPGKSKVNEYIYLDDGDRGAARALLKLGVTLEVQDVPATRAQALRALVPELVG